MTEEEFRTRVMCHRQLMMAVAMTVLCNRDDALDCLQETFAGLWNYRDHLSEIDNIRQYCFSATRNTALGMIKKLPVFMPMIASAEKNKTEKSGIENPYFFKYREQNGAEYAYISPLMIKTMKLTDKDLEGFPADKVEMVEILSLRWNANSILNAQIRKCIEDNDMELVGATTNKENRNSIYAKIDRDNKIKQLLILKWGPWFSSIKLLYIGGNFTINDLKDKL